MMKIENFSKAGDTMREIDNNVNLNFKGVQKPSIPEEPVSEHASSQVSPAQGKQINDLKNMPSEMLGKSQVAQSSFIERDVKQFQENPQLTAALNQAIEQYAKNHSEEETLKFMDSAVQEFFTKK